MKQRITFRNNTLGSIDVVVKPMLEPNTFEIGNKIFDFSLIVPKEINLHNEDFHIIIFDGVYIQCNILIGTEGYYAEDTYLGKIGLHMVKHETLLISGV